MKWPTNIAVVDKGGNLVSHVRMDGAWIGSIDAFTARAFDISTKELGQTRNAAAPESLPDSAHQRFIFERLRQEFDGLRPSLLGRSSEQRLVGK